MHLVACLTATWLAATCAAGALPLTVEVRDELDSPLANIHVVNGHRVGGELAFTYGSCAGLSRDKSAHHEIASAEVKTGDARLVWIIPGEAPSGGCVSAWDGAGKLVGRSRGLDLGGAKGPVARRAAEPIPMSPSNHFDPLGPWFDGLKFVSDRNHEPSPVDVRAAKTKEIAIVGAGISGLMTYLVLHQSGFTNVTILEADARIGGRIHTAYLRGSPAEYAESPSSSTYQDLGAMRLPLDYTDPASGDSINMSDFQLVYALVEEMNRLNAGQDALRMKLIPWVDDSDNGLLYYGEFKMPSGLPPTVAQARANASLARHSDTNPVLDRETAALRQRLNESLPGRDFMVDMAKSMYKAHREWIDGRRLPGRQKGDRWSEFAFLSHYLHGNLNGSDMLSQLDNPAGSFWTYLVNYFYEYADNWRTMDGGFGRLPASFEPLVRDALRLNTSVQRIDYMPDAETLGGNGNRRLSIRWKRHWSDNATQATAFDYAVVTAPFTVVRNWRLPLLRATMANAVQNLVYDSCCKVVLEYERRFWERLPNPILGSCSTQTDVPGIGIVCYPSYGMNSSGPAAVIGSYAEGTVNHGMSRLVTMSDEEHVRMVLDAMAEIHGEDTRGLYTGRFARKCWSMDPFAAGGWASPTVGQHELYMPEYFRVHSNMIFVGEHTSFTHGWISSALDSGIRGAVQLLLELGLVDEAKAAVRKWMAGWIKL